MKPSIFRTEVLEHRFKRPEAISIRKFPLFPILSTLMVSFWGAFVLVLASIGHIQTEQFIGITAPPDRNFFDMEKYPSARMLGLIIVPASSAKNLVEGYHVEMTISDDAFSSLPPIKSTVVRLINSARVGSGGNSDTTNNFIAVVLFPETSVINEGEMIRLEEGRFFKAQIRTGKIKILRLMLKPMEVLLGSAK